MSQFAHRFIPILGKLESPFVFGLIPLQKLLPFSGIVVIDVLDEPKATRDIEINRFLKVF
jgi:hypothetical protein